MWCPGLYSGGGLIVAGLWYAHKVKVSSLIIILLLYAKLLMPVRLVTGPCRYQT